MTEVLFAAAYLVGEYPRYAANDRMLNVKYALCAHLLIRGVLKLCISLLRYCDSVSELLTALVQPCVGSLPPHIQACFLHTCLKLIAAMWRKILPRVARKSVRFSLRGSACIVCQVFFTEFATSPAVWLGCVGRSLVARSLFRARMAVMPSQQKMKTMTSTLLTETTFLCRSGSSSYRDV